MAQRTIKPMRNPRELLLNPSTAWIGATALPGDTGTMVNLSYVAGFFDAVALLDLNSSKLKEVSAALEGMDFLQVTDSLTKFYKENPQWRDYHPALVIITILPDLKLHPVATLGTRV
jgi:hypothetical protein